MEQLKIFESEEFGSIRTGNETQKSPYTGKREITPYADDYVQKPTFFVCLCGVI